jgi:hypothetical protein
MRMAAHRFPGKACSVALCRVRAACQLLSMTVEPSANSRSRALRDGALASLRAVTALVLAVFAFTAGPADAQTIVDSQRQDFGQSQTTVNAAKRTTPITTILITPANGANSLSGTNPDPGNVATLFQLIDFTQTLRLDSNILIINSGFIDPVVGIFSQITNSVGSFSNNALMSNAAGGSTSGNVTQILALDQSSLIASDITKINSGNIIAGVTGIFAGITNVAVGSFANEVVGSNANGQAIPISLNDLLQSAAFVQSNAIDSNISITNSGALVAPAGISTSITNLAIGSLSNNALVSNANGTATAVTLFDLAQTIDLEQSNAITNATNIENGGSFAGIDGVTAAIANRTIGILRNNAGISNVNGNAVAAGVSDFSQLGRAHAEQRDPERRRHLQRRCDRERRIRVAGLHRQPDDRGAQKRHAAAVERKRDGGRPQSLRALAKVRSRPEKPDRQQHPTHE